MKEQITGFINDNIEKVREKKELWIAMNRVKREAISTNKITKEEAKLAEALLQYVHYKGSGMYGENTIPGHTVIDVEDKTEAYKDRVAPGFRHVRDFILNCMKLDRYDIMNDYLKAMDIYGISITISPAIMKERSPNFEEVNRIVDEEMNAIMTEICGLNDEINENAQVTADEINMLNIANPEDDSMTPVKVRRHRVKYAMDKVLTDEKRRTKQYIEEKNEMYIHKEIMEFIGDKDENDLKEDLEN